MSSSNTKTLHGHNYWTSLLNIGKTVARYESQQREDRASGDPKRAYDAWMCGRRVTQYVEHYDSQSQGIHEVALWVNGAPVCVCGLISPNECVRDDGEAHLASIPGHISHPSKELTTCFVVVDSYQEGTFRWLCQVCGFTKPAEHLDEGGFAAVRHSCG